MKSFGTRLVCGLAVLLLIPTLAMAQQRGTITGSVTGADTDESLPGASVQVVESQVGTATDVDGNFTISGVEPGEKTLRASFVGYSSVTRTVTVNAGETTNVDFTLQPSTRDLGEVVVTGVTSETPQAKLSFSVDQISEAQLSEAPANSPVGSLQGKVAGASIIPGSGAPGSGFDVRLRGATSISGDNSPLFIVDGVILGANQRDINSLDIKNVEIVKGAAASSLYGSRAQNGVVNITTKRGSDNQLGETRITVRSEFGVQDLREYPSVNRAHNFATNDDGVIIDSDGNPIDFEEGNAAVDNNGPNGQTTFFNKSYDDLRRTDGSSYDTNEPFRQFFNPGNTRTNYIAVSQNSERTNFRLSFEDTREEGPIQGDEASTNGFERQSFRLNIDHRPSERWNLSASGYYQQSTSDDPQGGDDAPFFDLWFMNPLADLTAKDDEGELVIQPDPNAIEGNPLYPIANADLEETRERFLGNIQAEYSPLEWMDLSANLSYDRSDREDAEFYKKGYKQFDSQAKENGEIERQYWIDEALNADLTASFAREFGEWTTRSQLKYQIEQQDLQNDFVQGEDLAAQGISDFDNVSGTKTISSSFQEIRSEAYYATLSGDYGDRYIADFLVRRDGSSLFGDDERWQTYFRAAGAYRVSEEDFWPLQDVVDDFKVRYSYGTAGGRPNYEAQYQTFELSGGQAQKNTQGNSELKPEFQTEQEYGLEFSVYDRVFVNFTYADSKVEDQILRVPLPAVRGFSAQWRNAGTVESNTYELSIDADLLRTRDISWSAGLTFDRTRQEITEFDANPFRTGPAQHPAFFFREGETVGTIYGRKFITKESELERMGYDPSNFAENDDGYLVPVGDASPTDGFSEGACEEDFNGDGSPESANGCWGTTVNTANGALGWGLPQILQDSTGINRKIGDTNPDFNVNFRTNFQYKGFSAYTLLSAQVGGDVYNATRQWGVRDNRAEEVGQLGVSQEKQKPQSYYQRLYNTNSKNSEFVEDASFLKVREVSLGYTFDESQLTDLLGTSAVSKIGLRLVGRNLFLFSDYQGVDPEVGGGTNNDAVNNSGSIFRIDDFEYPTFRTITGRIEVQF